MLLVGPPSSPHPPQTTAYWCDNSKCKGPTESHLCSSEITLSSKNREWLVQGSEFPYPFSSSQSSIQRVAGIRKQSGTVHFCWPAVQNVCKYNKGCSTSHQQPRASKFEQSYTIRILLLLPFIPTVWLRPSTNSYQAFLPFIVAFSALYGSPTLFITASNSLRRVFLGLLLFL